MSLDDWIQGDVSSNDTSGGSSGDSSTSYDTREGVRWNTKIDFGADYIIVAEDSDGNLYRHKDHLCVLSDRLDWRRLDDHPSKQMKVLYRCGTKQDWVRFCSRAQDQLGIDPEELFEEKPRKLQEVSTDIHYPDLKAVDDSRDCRICGANSEDPQVEMTEIDLQTKRRVPVCLSHTIEDLAYADLLE